jgi:hypothetical protein
MTVIGRLPGPGRMIANPSPSLKRSSNVSTLAPLVKQEIFYRLLMGEQGPRLRRITSAESHSYQIARAID